jgi:hypothetical protein
MLIQKASWRDGKVFSHREFFQKWTSNGHLKGITQNPFLPLGNIAINRQEFGEYPGTFQQTYTIVPTQNVKLDPTKSYGAITTISTELGAEPFHRSVFVCIRVDLRNIPLCASKLSCPGLRLRQKTRMPCQRCPIHPHCQHCRI